MNTDSALKAPFDSKLSAHISYSSYLLMIKAVVTQTVIYYQNLNDVFFFFCYLDLVFHVFIDFSSTAVIEDLDPESCQPECTKDYCQANPFAVCSAR